MDLLGIGVLIAAIAFCVLVIFLIRALNNLSSVLAGVDKTVEKLPDQLDDVMQQSSQVIENGNQTLTDLNEKMQALTPLFYMVGDAGEASRKFSSSLADFTVSLKKNTNEGKEAAQKKDLGGIYGMLAFIYYLTQKRKAWKEAKEGSGTNNEN
ncbi:Uncharacterized protein YoxC, contains an MCP-like domain [Alteribacillus persepolensis]|uniref:Uncharacterized protein YoxC, contains an MCP-like domain n=1 Tax=Alteribacillus persepolensis TaxID=568899 RepID=A0A1G8K1T1_9BACI|nr:DUF948 domain-containing protein [Alteribacillus persepolensis]SDI37339.1 Uncharacterized protein YoxC, contains an MCP-like domain [Alteribacillus persepolensis]